MISLSKIDGILLVLVLALMPLTSLAQDHIADTPQAVALDYGSKVYPTDLDEGKALVTFPTDPIFAYLDSGAVDNSGRAPLLPGIDTTFYIHANPSSSLISLGDIRLTPYHTPDHVFGAGSQVRSGDEDQGLRLRRLSDAQVVYIDQMGDGHYDLIDPVYLSFHSGYVRAGDVRITGNVGFGPGTRVADASNDNDRPSKVLPGGFGFYNLNGDIDERGLDVYDPGDLVYLDLDPSGQATVNDVRVSYGSLEAESYL